MDDGLYRIYDCNVSSLLNDGRNVRYMCVTTLVYIKGPQSPASRQQVQCIWLLYSVAARYTLTKTLSGLGLAMMIDRIKIIKRKARLEKMALEPLANASIPSSAFEDQPKTPDQPIHPSDSKHSGSSTESKPEEPQIGLSLSCSMNAFVLLQEQCENLHGLKHKPL